MEKLAPDPLLVRIGQRIARLRAVHPKRFTQADLAEAAGADIRVIQRMEAGQTGSALTKLRDVARVLGVSLEDLVAPGDPHAEDESELQLLAVWRALPEERREVAIRVLRELGR